MDMRSFHEGHKNGRRACQALLVLAALILVAAAGAAEPAQKADIKIEDGVRVVRNPKTPVAGPGGAPASVSLVEDLIIGNDTGREDYWFGMLNALDVDASGNIYTVDPKSIRIRIFGPEGNLVKAFGRSGQGPGEFSGPGAIVAAPDGTVVVSDVLNARLSLFTREGTHLRDVPHGTYRLGGLAIDRHSNLYASDYQAPAGGTMVLDLIKLNQDMKLLAKIHSLPIPFKPRTVNLISTRLLFGLVGQDRVAWMDSAVYEIRVADASARAVMRILKEGGPRKVTEEYRAKALKSRFPNGAPPQITIEFPEYFPAASGFMTDEKGWIYVRTNESDGRGGTAVDVFDGEGLYVARFFVAEDEDTVVIRNDKLYCIVMDPASGNPLVKRCALKWK